MTAKKTWYDRIASAFATKDKAAFDEALGEMKAKGEMHAPGEAKDGAMETPAGVHIHLHGSQAMTPAGGVKDDDGEGEEMMEDKKDQKDAEARPSWFDEHVKSNNARFDSIEKMLHKMAGEKTDDEEPFKEEEVAEEGEEEAEGNVIDGEYAEGEEGEDTDEVEEKKGTNVDKKTSKDKKGVKDKATVDSTGLQPAFREFLAGAEILSPGIKLPTFDAKAVRKSTQDTMCILARRALMAHVQTQDGAKAMMTLTGKKEFTTRGMPCDAVSTLFRGAVGLAKARNSRGTIDLASVASKADKPKAPTTIADLNRQNRKRFGQTTY